jgi:hypothetical protein
MTARLHRIGAGFFFLWGVVHVVGGASLLARLESGGGAAILRVLGSAVPATVPDAVPGIAGAVAGFHAWNMLWVGALVALVAASVGSRYRDTGLWLNLVLAGCADLGLILALLLPGYMRLSEGMIGIVLFVLAAAFSLAGRSSARPGTPYWPAGQAG